MEDLMTASEAAEYLRLNYMTLCRLARQGKVPAVKVGGEWRFKREIVDGMFKGEDRSRKKAVLVVDDDPRIRDILVDIVGADGCHVVAVDAGTPALAEIARRSFDLVFLDLVLPDMSGVEVLKNIKRRSPETAIAVVTGYGDEPIASEALSLGPMILLRKPFAIQDVRQVLRLSGPREAAGRQEKARP